MVGPAAARTQHVKKPSAAGQFEYFRVFTPICSLSRRSSGASALPWLRPSGRRSCPGVAQPLASCTSTAPGLHRWSDPPDYS